MTEDQSHALAALAIAETRPTDTAPPRPFREERRSTGVSYAGGLGSVLSLMLATRPDRPADPR
jgi:hypothetical protein